MESKFDWEKSFTLNLTIFCLNFTKTIFKKLSFLKFFFSFIKKLLLFGKDKKFSFVCFQIHIVFYFVCR